MSNFDEVGLLPCLDGGVTVPFRLNKVGNLSAHRANDIGWYKTPNCPVFAWQDGKVIRSYTKTNGGDMGCAVVLEHTYADGTKRWTCYMHFVDKSAVAVGKQVKMGDVIGYRGNTGASNGVHLHFMISKKVKQSLAYSYANLYNNCTFDPMNLCYIDEAHDWSNYIDPTKPMPKRDELNVGDKVIIKAQGNSKPDGKGLRLSKFSIGWKRIVKSIDKKAAYPYLVGTEKAVTGYFKEDQLEKY